MSNLFLLMNVKNIQSKLIKLLKNERFKRPTQAHKREIKSIVKLTLVSCKNNFL